MATREPRDPLADVLAQLATLRDELAEQRRVNGELREAIGVLQSAAQPASSVSGDLTSTPGAQGITVGAALAKDEASDAPGGAKRGKVGRRGLLLGAAGVATATVATAAIAASSAGTPTALAAANTSGANAILGQINDADQPTVFVNTSGINTNVIEANFTTTTTESPANNAIYAQAFFDTSVGHGTGGIGPAVGGAISGYSDTGFGVAGASLLGFDLMAYGGGLIYQSLQLGAFGPAGTPPPSGPNDAPGESLRDFFGELWLCTGFDGSGNSIWVRVSHTLPGANGGAINYLAKPIRLLDTRGGDSLAQIDGGGPIAGGSPTGAPYTLTIGGVSWQSVTVPSGVAGAMGNVTAVAGSGGGYLAIVPHGAGFTGTATLAYGPNQVVSNSFNTALSGDKLDILIGGSAANVILDLIAVVA